MDSIGIPKFNGVFIRAPSVSDVGSGIEILSKFNERIIAVKKGNVIGTAFHPELTEDTSLHKFFVNLIKTSKNYWSSILSPMFCLSLAQGPAPRQMILGFTWMWGQIRTYRT
jgi:hypothetical protein